MLVYCDGGCALLHVGHFILLASEEWNRVSLPTRIKPIIAIILQGVYRNNKFSLSGYDS